MSFLLLALELYMVYCCKCVSEVCAFLLKVLTTLMCVWAAIELLDLIGPIQNDLVHRGGVANVAHNCEQSLTLCVL